MRVLGIGGEPCSGKSTLVRSMLPELGGPAGFVFGSLRGAAYKNNYRPVYLLGLYPEGETFGGTDRLSMAVQPYFEMFLERMKGRDCAVLFEGDRLFNSKSIEKIKQVAPNDHLFAILATTPSEQERRHKQRQDDQSERFLRSRATKLHNLASRYPADIVFWGSQNDTDLINNQAKIRQILLRD